MMKTIRSRSNQAASHKLLSQSLHQPVGVETTAIGRTYPVYGDVSSYATQKQLIHILPESAPVTCYFHHAYYYAQAELALFCNTKACGCSGSSTQLNVASLKKFMALNADMQNTTLGTSTSLELIIVESLQNQKFIQHCASQGKKVLEATLDNVCAFLAQVKIPMANKLEVLEPFAQRKGKSQIQLMAAMVQTKMDFNEYLKLKEVALTPEHQQKMILEMLILNQDATAFIKQYFVQSPQVKWAAQQYKEKLLKDKENLKKKQEADTQNMLQRIKDFGKLVGEANVDPLVELCDPSLSFEALSKLLTAEVETEDALSALFQHGFNCAAFVKQRNIQQQQFLQIMAKLNVEAKRAVQYIIECGFDYIAYVKQNGIKQDVVEGAVAKLKLKEEQALQIIIECGLDFTQYVKQHGIQQQQLEVVINKLKIGNEKALEMLIGCGFGYYTYIKQHLVTQEEAEAVINKLKMGDQQAIEMLLECGLDCVPFVKQHNTKQDIVLRTLVKAGAGKQMVLEVLVGCEFKSGFDCVQYVKEQKIGGEELSEALSTAGMPVKEVIKILIECGFNPIQYVETNKIDFTIVIEVIKGMKGNWIEAVAKMDREVLMKVIQNVDLPFAEVLELSKGIQGKDKLIMEFVEQKNVSVQEIMKNSKVLGKPLFETLIKLQLIELSEEQLCEQLSELDLGWAEKIQLMKMSCGSASEQEFKGDAKLYEAMTKREIEKCFQKVSALTIQRLEHKDLNISHEKIQNDMLQSKIADMTQLIQLLKKKVDELSALPTKQKGEFDQKVLKIKSEYTSLLQKEQKKFEQFQQTNTKLMREQLSAFESNAKIIEKLQQMQTQPEMDQSAELLLSLSKSAEGGLQSPKSSISKITTQLQKSNAQYKSMITELTMQMGMLQDEIVTTAEAVQEQQDAIIAQNDTLLAEKELQNSALVKQNAELQQQNELLSKKLESVESVAMEEMMNKCELRIQQKDAEIALYDERMKKLYSKFFEVNGVQMEANEMEME